MSKNVIIFGAKKFGVSNAPVVTSKYPNTAVITVEPSKKGGRSRRVLFNAKASELLNLEMGEVQQIVFGFVQGEAMGLIANASLLEEDVVQSMTTYRTSKNKVSFESTKERGKAISSSTIANEIATYYDLDNTVENELSLEVFDSNEVESFSMSIMNSEDFCDDKSCDENVVSDDTQIDISDENVTFTEITPEEEVQPEQEPVAVESNDSDFNINRSSTSNEVVTGTNWN